MMATMPRKITTREDALETILEYVEGMEVSPIRRSQALLLLERDADLLAFHEARLLGEAWKKVNDDTAQRRWEEMGRG